MSMECWGTKISIQCLGTKMSRGLSGTNELGVLWN